MPVYAVGDIQGCFDTLAALLAKIAFDPTRDGMVLVGDLVNRGPRSLDVLRWAKAHSACVKVVLGNHDVHLIRRFLGLAGAKRKDTIDDVLRAPDAAQLVRWLSSQPLVIDAHDHVFVHAGLLPSWTIEAALRASDAASRVLRGENATQLLAPEEGDELADLRYFVRAVTNVRVCDPDGVVDFDFEGGHAAARFPYAPWFRHRARQSRGRRIVFGHWSALGVHQEDGVQGLDSGCVWGRSLTAMRLSDGHLISQPALEGSRNDLATIATNAGEP